MLHVAEENAGRWSYQPVVSAGRRALLAFSGGNVRSGNLPLWRDVFRGCRSGAKRDPEGVATRGLLAMAAWGPMEQSTLAVSAMGPFLRRVNVPPPDPGSPNPFKFATRGSLSKELEKAGFDRVVEQSRIIDCSWPGPPEELWDCFREIASPLLSPIIDSMSPEDQQLAINEVIEDYRGCYDGQRVKPQPRSCWRLLCAERLPFSVASNPSEAFSRKCTIRNSSRIVASRRAWLAHRRPNAK